MPLNICTWKNLTTNTDILQNGSKKAARMKLITWDCSWPPMSCVLCLYQMNDEFTHHHILPVVHGFKVKKNNNNKKKTKESKYAFPSFTVVFWIMQHTKYVKCLHARENRQWLTTAADCPQSLTKALIKQKKKTQNDIHLKTKIRSKQHARNMFISHKANCYTAFRSSKFPNIHVNCI